MADPGTTNVHSDGVATQALEVHIPSEIVGPAAPNNVIQSGVLYSDYPLPKEYHSYCEVGFYSLILPSQIHALKRGTDNGMIKTIYGPGDLVIVNNVFKNREWRFGCVQTPVSLPLNDIGSWKHCVQDEGQSYYYLASGESRYFSYLTKLNLSEHAVRSELDCCIAWLEKTAHELPDAKKEKLSTNIEVVLEKNTEPWGGWGPRTVEWYYYMADIELQTLVFLHEMVLPDSMLPALKRKQQEHLPLFFVIEYWEHVRNFPTHRKSSRETKEVLGILNEHLLDNVLEPRNALDAIFDTQDIQKSLGFIKELVAQTEDAQNNSKLQPGHLMSRIATIMLALKRDRFRTLCRDVPKANRTWLAWLMLPLLLFKPGSILQQIEEMYNDRFISKQEWTALQEKLEKESSIFIIYATVLLAVDISFLAVPSVSGDSLHANQTTLTTLMGQISMIICLGSIIIGLLDTRQERIDHNNKANWYTSGSKVNKYLNGDSNPQWRLETLAIQYSLPFGLLQWGILAFAVSVLTSCFDANPTIVGMTARRWIYGVVCVCMACLVLWTIHTRMRMNSSRLPGIIQLRGDNRSENGLVSMLTRFSAVKRTECLGLRPILEPSREKR